MKRERGQRRWASRLVATAAFAAAALAPEARAATINVDTAVDQAGNDDASCSLREAVRSAAENSNAHETGCEQGESASPDTVAMPTGTFSLTLAGGNEDAGLQGDLDNKVISAGDLNVVGTGPTSTIIDASAAGDRAFDLQNHDFSVSNLRIRDGSPPANGDGGAILMDGTTAATSLTLTSVAIISSVASGPGGDGGGVSFVGDDNDLLTITGSAIFDNQASIRGGGVHAPGVNTVGVTESAITANEIVDVGAGNETGGGLYLQSGGVLANDYDVTASTISGNSTPASGGGIGVDVPTGAGDALTVDASVIAGNSAGETGGGIKTALEKTTVVDSIIRDNDAIGMGAPTGGGIDALLVESELDVIRSTLEGNRSSFRGGGISFGGDQLQVLNSTISDNTAPNGSAVHVVDTAGVTGGQIARFGHVTVSQNTGASAIRAETVDELVSMQLRESIFDQPQATACEEVGGPNAAFFGFGGNFDRGTSCADIAPEQNQDAALLPLAGNGGPSAGAPGIEEVIETHAILGSSVAVDSILAANCTDDGITPGAATQDQRGEARPDTAAGICDSGAFELTDGDGDGVDNATDNCPAAANGSQSDADADGIGDVCDPTPNIPVVPVVPGTPTTLLAPTSNDFSFGKLTRNKRKGTASIAVTTPGAGRLDLEGKGLRSVSLATAGGQASLTIASGKRGKQALRLRRRLAGKGKAGVTARVAFTPSGGTANTKRLEVKLLRERRAG